MAIATAAFVINTNTGDPTTYSSIATNPSSTYPVTYTNTTGGSQTIYIYFHSTVAATMSTGDSTLVYSYAVYTPPSGWVGVNTTLNVPSSTDTYATTAISSLGAGEYLNATFTPGLTGKY